MDSIHLTDSGMVLHGLRSMMEAAVGMHEMVHMEVPIETALLIIECAKRAPDDPAWFPRGQWATIQALEARVNLHLDPLFKEFRHSKQREMLMKAARPM